MLGIGSSIMQYPRRQSYFNVLQYRATPSQHSGRREGEVSVGRHGNALDHPPPSTQSRQQHYVQCSDLITHWSRLVSEEGWEVRECECGRERGCGRHDLHKQLQLSELPCL